MPSDQSFFIYHEADPTKNIRFDVGSVVTNSVLTISLPATSGNDTLALLNNTQIWLAVQSFDDTSLGTHPVVEFAVNAVGSNAAAFRVRDIFKGTKCDLQIPAAGFTVDQAVTLQDASGTVALLEANQTWTGGQTFGPSTLFVTDNIHTASFANDLASGDAPIYLPDTGSRNARLTAGLNGAEKNLLAQSADIATANVLTLIPAQMYRVSYVLEDTSADLTAGAVTLTLAWTDDAGATTATATQVLTAAGRTSGSVVLYLAAGNITYAIGHTGIFGTAQYALRLRVEAIG